MQVARWRWLLVPMVVAGCLPSSGQLPPGLASQMHDAGNEIRVAAPIAGTIPAAEILARLRGERGDPPFLPGPIGQPIFAFRTCIAARYCDPSNPLGRPRAVWFVPYPGTPGAAYGGDAFAVMDATTGEFLFGDGPPD